MYFVVEDFMTRDLHLQHTELLVYALVHTFSQKEQGCYFGSLSFTADLLGCSKMSVVRAIKSLQERNLIKECGINSSTHTTQYIAVVTPVTKCDSGNILSRGGSQNVNRGVTKCDTITNSIDNININNNKERNIKKESSITLPYSSSRFVELWDQLLKEKEWRKKSEGALLISAKRLGEMSESDAILAIEQTIENGWRGIFPPRKQKQKSEEEMSLVEFYRNEYGIDTFR